MIFCVPVKLSFTSEANNIETRVKLETCRVQTMEIEEKERAKN